MKLQILTPDTGSRRPTAVQGWLKNIIYNTHPSTHPDLSPPAEEKASSPEGLESAATNPHILQQRFWSHCKKPLKHWNNNNVFNNNKVVWNHQNSYHSNKTEIFF